MNQREKEEYLREYSILKSQGKPFFPYAVAKDSLMGCLVIAIIIAGIHREDRAKTLIGNPRTHTQAATRRMLGVGVRHGNADSGEPGDE